MIKFNKHKVGNLILLFGLRSLNATMLTTIACIGGCRSVHILNGGNRFTASIVARTADQREKEDAS
jgi:hypothetical protein